MQTQMLLGILRLLGYLFAWEVGSFALLWGLMFACRPFRREKVGLPALLYPLEVIYVLYHFPAILVLTRVGKKEASGLAVAGLTFAVYGTALTLLVLLGELVVYVSRR
jgi:hypothetical protein